MEVYISLEYKDWQPSISVSLNETCSTKFLDRIHCTQEKWNYFVLQTFLNQSTEFVQMVTVWPTNLVS